jgi:Spy/CpxP family protein refolding chaperone
MLRKSIFLCAVLLSASAVAFAQGQGQGRQRGPRGGGPMGMGFGGGMFSGAMGKVFLLQNPQIQKELELTAEQKEKLQGLQADFGFGGNRGNRENPPSREEMRQRAEKLDGEIKEILLPNQMERLNQIRVQLMGPAAFQDPDVAKDLGISEDQQKKMTTLRDEFMKDFQKKLMEHIAAALTPEQKAKFEKLIGEKFDLDMSQMFGNRNRGRNGRNRPAPVN